MDPTWLDPIRSNSSKPNPTDKIQPDSTTLDPIRPIPSNPTQSDPWSSIQFNNPLPNPTQPAAVPDTTRHNSRAILILSGLILTYFRDG